MGGGEGGGAGRRLRYESRRGTQVYNFTYCSLRVSLMHFPVYPPADDKIPNENIPTTHSGSKSHAPFSFLVSPLQTAAFL